jgi:hypothetical protein
MTENGKIEWQHRGTQSRCALIIFAFSSMLVLGSLGASATPAQDGLDFFETKIRPVLVERCYKCHSATSEKLKGGLYLDSRESMLRGGDTRPAIVPGDAEKSLLVEAIRYQNSDLQMPPKEKLSDVQISDFVSWIKMGALWPSAAGLDKVVKTSTFDLEKRRQLHWSWKPIQSIQPPAVKHSAWTECPVDQFILSKLEEKSLSPALPADKRTLIRRATFDLIGLPPTPGEVKALLDDSSPKAFERVVDRLLASPHFGERWARHWLDLVRYSETLGHEFDYPNFNAWRYRDYVIRAFNADIPYNQFVMEQVAGDLLEKPRYHPTQGFNESVIGTGFFWLGQRAHSPVDVRLEQAEVIDNQIDVTAKAFLGLTVACARCHDHKFDAISTRDYYSLFGVLSSSRYAQHSVDPPGDLNARAEGLKVLKNELRPLIGEAWINQSSSIADYLTAVREVVSADSSATPANRVREVSEAHRLDSSRLERWVRALADKETVQANEALSVWVKVAQASKQPNTESFPQRLRSAINEARQNRPGFPATSKAESFGDFSARDFSGWSVEDEAFGTSPSAAGDFVVGDANRPVLAVLTEPAANSASVSRRFEGVLRSPTFTIQKRYAHILACGADSRLSIRVDNFTMIRDPIYGELKRLMNDPSLEWITVDLETWKGHRAYFEFDDQALADPSDEANKKFSALAYIAVSRIVFSEEPSPPSSSRAPFPALDELAHASSVKQLAELYQRASTTVVKAWAENRLNGVDAPGQIAWLDWLVRNSLLEIGHENPAEHRLAAALAEFQKIEDRIPEHPRAVGMVDGTGLDENVFIRGSHKTLGEPVQRRFLEALGGCEKTRFTQGSGRLELARSITDPSNPFISRVMVNRIWLHLFGRGIVPTPDDFGALGQPPTHPELLDWLAHWYETQGGWSSKRLIRMLMTSQAYRMSSRPVDTVAEEKDPQNLLFHRMPVRRLECEPIRDALLAVSGQLDPEMFGPPVPVYLTEFMEGRGRPTQSGPIDGAGRRSIYQEVRRNFLPPIMRAFDFPVPFSTVGKRTVSNVPAQSLILMNDPFVIGQAQAWAKSLLANHGQSPEERITAMYETLFSRPPTSSELAKTMSFLQQQSKVYGSSPRQLCSDQALWSDLCQVLMNVKEFIFLN